MVDARASDALLWHAGAIARHAAAHRAEVEQLHARLRASEAAKGEYARAVERAGECFDALYAEVHHAWRVCEAHQRRADAALRLYEGALRERALERVETQRVLLRQQSVADALRRRLTAAAETQRCEDAERRNPELVVKGDDNNTLKHDDVAGSHTHTHTHAHAHTHALETEAVTPTKGNSQDSWSDEWVA